MMGEPDRDRLRQIGRRLLGAVTEEEMDSGVRVIVLVRDQGAGSIIQTGYAGQKQDVATEVLSDLIGAAGVVAEDAGIGMSVFPMDAPMGGQG